MMYDQFDNEWDLPSSSSSDFNSQVGKPDRDSNKPRFVAVKKIYVTSSPLRIYNELELLHSLKGCASVCPLITAFRYQDQVIAILPHFRHQDFRVCQIETLPQASIDLSKLYYRSMSVYDIKVYFRSMFEALAAVHKHKIIHRDIKPT